MKATTKERWKIIEAKMADLLALVRDGGLSPRDLQKRIDDIYNEFPEDRYKVALEETTLYDKLRMWDKALEATGKALQAVGGQVSEFLILMKRAKYLGIMGRVEEAAIIFEQILSMSLKEEEALLVYAHYVKMLMTHNKWPDAVSVLRRGLLRFPGNVVMKTKLAMCLKSLGKLEEALLILNSLDQSDPYVRMEKAHVFVNLLDAKQARKELNTAKSLFMQMHRSDRRLRNRWERQSIIQRLQALEVAVSAVEGKVKEAEEWFEKNHSVFPAAKLVGVVLNYIRDATSEGRRIKGSRR